MGYTLTLSEAGSHSVKHADREGWSVVASGEAQAVRNSTSARTFFCRHCGGGATSQ